MKVVSKYQAYDGRIFDVEDECLSYELAAGIKLTGAAAEGDAESAYELAMMCLQSNRYVEEGGDFATAVDRVLAWSAPSKRSIVGRRRM